MCLDMSITGDGYYEDVVINTRVRRSSHLWGKGKTHLKFQYKLTDFSVKAVFCTERAPFFVEVFPSAVHFWSAPKVTFTTNRLRTGCGHTSWRWWCSCRPTLWPRSPCSLKGPCSSGLSTLLTPTMASTSGKIHLPGLRFYICWMFLIKWCLTWTQLSEQN